jgi:hypothetical protein
MSILPPTVCLAVSLLGLAACGDGGDREDPTAQAPTPPPAIATDAAAGVGPVGSVDAGVGTASACTIGMACRLPNGASGVMSCLGAPVCVDPGQVVSGLLDSGIVNGLLDSGLLLDSGISFGDGSIMFGDASIPLEAGTLKCPEQHECSQLGAALGLPISACVKSGEALPPTCLAAGMGCMVGTNSGSCQDFILAKVCITPCN